MKRKKKMTTIMVGLLTLLLPMNGYAKNTLNVWIDESNLEIKSSEMSVDIETAGISTDGLLVITYDQDSIQVTENNVTLTDEIKMSSVHVVEDGVLKIAYLAEKPIERGTLATINFKVTNDAASDNLLLLEGDVHDADGNALQVGLAETEESPETDKPEDDTPENTLPDHDNKTDDTVESSKDSVSTGDDANILLYLISGGLSLAVAGILLFKMKKRRG